jgi:hypothetical protein
VNSIGIAGRDNLRGFGLNKAHENILGVGELVLVERVVLDGSPNPTKC